MSDSIKFEDAKLCLDCDTIHDQQRCPKCFSAAWHPVAKFLAGRKPVEVKKGVKNEPRRFETRVERRKLARKVRAFRSNH